MTSYNKCGFWPGLCPCHCFEISELRASLSITCLELGLRWLNDRIEDDHRDQFGAFIKDAFPSIMTGIAHGLILDAQQKIADEFKADPDSMRKLRNKHRELTKRRKKNIP